MAGRKENRETVSAFKQSLMAQVIPLLVLVLIIIISSI